MYNRRNDLAWTLRMTRESERRTVSNGSTEKVVHIYVCIEHRTQINPMGLPFRSDKCISFDLTII